MIVYLKLTKTAGKREDFYKHIDLIKSSTDMAVETVDVKQLQSQKVLNKREIKGLKKATKKYVKRKYDDFYELMKTQPFRKRWLAAKRILFKKGLV